MPKRLLVIDFLNIFLRHYIVDPSLNFNGDPIGGIQGFLKGLQKIIRETKPDRIVICWDGEGGSKRRKQQNKNYKEGRSPIRLNRTIKGLVGPQQELENKIWQMSRLSEYLDALPIYQTLLNNTEADDVIAYTVQHEAFAGYKKIILSSDRDFIQLIGEGIILFRPIQKEILNTKRTLEKYGIHPINFALARSIVGDKSDNIAGVKGVGLLTLAKRFPFLSEARFYTIPEVMDHSRELLTNSAKRLPLIYQNIVDNEKLITNNYRLIQLGSPSISIQGKQEIDSLFADKKLLFNKTEFRRLMIQDGLGQWNFSALFQTCSRIVSDKSS